MKFIDSHVHFWNQDLMPYTWLHEVPAIAHRHTPETLREEAGPDTPEKIVFVECGAPGLDEVKWIGQLAAREPRIGAIVAKAAIDAGPQSAAALAELRKYPLVRGVRHMLQHEEDPKFCLRPEFIAGIHAVTAADLSFDLCCFHHQLESVVELVRRCPETRFILDHAGKPGIRAGLLDPWREHIRALAALPNVVCKLSGLVTEADHRLWTPEQLRPYVAHLLATFGPARLMFGGDWPVAKLACGYRRWLEIAREFTAALSEAERDAIFVKNATRAYRL